MTSHRLIWIDASAAPRPGRSCALPLVAVAGAAKKVSYGLNIMAPKVGGGRWSFCSNHVCGFAGSMCGWGRVVGAVWVGAWLRV